MAFGMAFPLYVAGAAGAGDVKTFATVGLVLPVSGILKLGFWTLFCVAAYGLLYKVACHKRGMTKVPMAPAMLLGAGIIMFTGGFG